MLMEPLWTATDLATILEIETTACWSAHGIQTDSRLVIPGDVFIALEGSQMDGHDFVNDAFDRGAVAALVHKRVAGLTVSDQSLFTVDDTHKALFKIAAAARSRTKAKVIAVTGSAGKTSVVQALKTSLSASFQAHSSIKSYNNHVGVPLSLSRMMRHTECAVFEIGMSSAGDIAPLTAVVKPDVAVITTIGAAHRQNFSDIRAIAREKAQIFSSMKAGAVAIIGMGHGHDQFLIDEANKKNLRVVKVGFDDSCDIYPDALFEAHDCSCLTLTLAGQKTTLRINQPGREWVLNAMLVLAAVVAVDADSVDAALALASLSVEKGRGKYYDLSFEAGSMLLQDDSYNANPLSMTAALERFIMIPPQKGQARVAILGDMAELGAESAACHDALLPLFNKAAFDVMITCGPEMHRIAALTSARCIHCEYFDEIIYAASGLFGDQTQVFIKGSNQYKLPDVVDYLLAAASNHK